KAAATTPRARMRGELTSLRLRRGGLDVDHEVPVLRVHADHGSLRRRAADQRARDACLDLALDEAPQRPGAEDRVEALAGDQVEARLAELEADLPLRQPRAQVLDQERHDLLDLGQHERFEQDGVVY